jgi:hypothetical protein
VHVWFSDDDIPRDVELDQLKALRDYQESLRAKALLGSYSSPTDLGYKVRQALEHDLAGIDGAGPPPKRGGANLVASYEETRNPRIDSKGRTTYQTRERLTVRNEGAASAEEVRLGMQPLEAGQGVPSVHGDDNAPTIAPGREFKWVLLTHAGVASAIRLTMTYRVAGKEEIETQDLSLW